MKVQHISVIIADRPYRLRVGSEEEEIIVREAAKVINTKMKEYGSHFAYKDKQDLLAMVALQNAVDVEKARKSGDYQKQMEDQLKNLENLLDHYLNT